MSVFSLTRRESVFAAASTLNMLALSEGEESRLYFNLVVLWHLRCTKGKLFVITVTKPVYFSSLCMCKYPSVFEFHLF